MWFNCFQVAAFSVHCLHGPPEEHIRKMTQLCTPTAGSKVPEFQPCGSVQVSVFALGKKHHTTPRPTAASTLLACFFTSENGIRRNLNGPLDLPHSPWTAYPPNSGIEVAQRASYIKRAKKNCSPQLQ
jgi:hypothetical protein